MRASQLFGRTLREDPVGAEAASDRLLLRAAFVRRLVAGVYTTLPLGVRTMRKIEDIVREEMDATGAQEIRMPIVVPAEPWKATGRWDAYGDLMFKLKDRHERDLGLGPTHEEVVTPLVAGEFSSYRDLPVNLYQIEWKYRDEFRPRYGLLRGREFLMKDAYSFDRDEDGMRASYDVMYWAYERVFDRCGLDYRIVEADPGQIGGGINHEYMAVTDAGEDLFLHCESCDYAADLEAATPRRPDPIGDVALEPLHEIHTPGAATIAAVSSLVGRPASQMLKCILFDAGGQTVAVLLPGDREVNEEKVASLFFPTPVRPFEDDDFAGRGFAKGYVGPQGMPDDAVVIADPLVRAGANWVTGANREDFHVTGANLDRDFQVTRWEDVVQAVEGDPCPVDGGRLVQARSIVVGHIYQLGTKYSEPLKATFVDEDGTEQLYVMGCYGIGISRILAAVAEQYHDEAGLRWPRRLAPFEVVVIPTNMDQPPVVEAAGRFYGELVAAGFEVVLDDREATAGVKFADADLIGYPVQVVVGRRGIESGEVDLKLRATGQRTKSQFSDLAQAVRALLASAP
ncbi:MAG: proline--tRNA ligase [Actinomycetota bacterium]